MHDLKVAKREREHPDLVREPTEMFIFPSFDRVNQYMDEFERDESNILSLDIEVKNETISHISFAFRPEEAMSIQFYKDGKNFFNPDQETEIWRRLAVYIEDPKIIKYYQNGG